VTSIDSSENLQISLRILHSPFNDKGTAEALTAAARATKRILHLERLTLFA
jgi:hypothetical protein